jgi:hypothetical protein
VPQFDPPFDDEVAPEVWASAHQLALDWPQPATVRRPAPAQPAPSTGVGPPPTAGATLAEAADAEPAGAEPAGAYPAGGDPAGAGLAGASVEAKLAVRRFVAVCVEVINGYRPAAHLRRLSRPGEAAGIVAQALAAGRRAGELRKAVRTSRAADRHGRGPAPVAVLRLRLCEPRPGVVEAAVLLVTGERTWALAVRLEQHHQTWTATTLRLV